MTIKSDEPIRQETADQAHPPPDVDPSVTTDERDGLHIPIFDECGYSVREQPMGTKRQVKVILMGAGASSLNFFHAAEEEMDHLDIVCYEKNEDVGGTWFENRYPGCACDIPSVNYQFNWKIKLWTHYYSYAPEIQEYMKEIEQDGNFIEKYIKLRHKIEKAEWDEIDGVWKVKVKNIATGDVFDDEAEFFINAGGVLNDWKMPKISGMDTFEGRIMHTANYDPTYNLKGKNVAVLGAGSSGLQAVAKIQDEVKHLYHWIRSPIWVTAGFAQTWAGSDGANFKYTPEQLSYLEQNPKKYLEYRKQIENELNQRFKFIIKGSNEANAARDFSIDQMKRKLNHDPRLCSKIIPKDFNPGCRRPTPAPGYLEALVADNSTIFTDEGIERMTKDGFVGRDSDGKEVEYPIDILICATGFDTSWLPRFPLLAHGKDLRDVWSQPTSSSPDAQGVTSYLAVSVPGFPNHFTFCGPYGPLGHGSFMPLIEHWTRYIFSCIRKYQTEPNIKSMEPSWRAALDFRQHADLFLKRTAWTSPCSSWFKGGKKEGQVAIWPGTRVSYLELLREVRWEDYNIERWNDGNRFDFLGNGFHVREFDGRDITFYLGSLEDDVEEREKEKQPSYDDGLIDRMAGWAVGF